MAQQLDCQNGSPLPCGSTECVLHAALRHVSSHFQGEGSSEAATPQAITLACIAATPATCTPAASDERSLFVWLFKVHHHMLELPYHRCLAGLLLKTRPAVGT